MTTLAPFKYLVISLQIFVFVLQVSDQKSVPKSMHFVFPLPDGRRSSVHEVTNIQRSLLPLSHPHADRNLIKCDKARQGKMGSDLDSAHASIGAVF